MKPIYSILSSVLLFTIASCKSNTSGDQGTATATPKGQHYSIDIPRSEVKWKAWNVFGSHTGTIPVSSGQLFISEGLITGGQIVMDMKNLQVSDLEGQDKADLEAHLRGTTPGKENDFFNTTQYPTATYTLLRSEKLNGDPEATDIIYGTLQIRDVSKPVNIKVKMDSGAANAIKITTLPFIIDRTEWGIKFWSKKLADTLKENIINDEVQIEFTIGAIAG